jgi:hypothetical protein
MEWDMCMEWGMCMEGVKIFAGFVFKIGFFFVHPHLSFGPMSQYNAFTGHPSKLEVTGPNTLMWWPDYGLAVAVTLTCALVSTPLTLAFVIGLFVGMEVERRLLQACRYTIDLCIERVKAETERCHWEVALLRCSRCTQGGPSDLGLLRCSRCTQGGPSDLGLMQDTATTAREVDEAVSWDHDSRPASLHSSEMLSMMPTIANGDL